MSVQSRKLHSVGQRVIRLQLISTKGMGAPHRFWIWLQRWFWMLYHEFIKDDVIIRAQSLSFLMVFSLLPLIAGVFFIFTFLAQFGMVQDALTNMTENFLSTIPSQHRAYVGEYILSFKDAYLAGITKASRSVGVFAIFILAWVGLQAFDNIDATLNVIWSAERNRPLYEKIRNFIVVSVVAPIVLICGFSVPIILHRFSVSKFFFERFSFLNLLLNTILPLVLLMGIFLMMYRYVPVRRVWWKAAAWGALFSTILVGVCNFGMKIYFAFGTNSAYGKAAVVPLIGFWIYVLWIVVIMGAEVSFLIQNKEELFLANEREPALGEARALLAILVAFYRAFRDGSGPTSFESARDAAEIDSNHTRCVIGYLLRKKIIVECAGDEEGGGHYSLARDPDTLNLADLFQDYFPLKHPQSKATLEKIWNKGVVQWAQYFETVRIADLAK